MLGMWTMFLATDQVPELSTCFYEIGLHIVPEVATALALIVGGYALFTNKKWGLQAYMFSMGMLLYTLIVSPGYYVQRDNIVMTGMFAVFFVIAIVFVGFEFHAYRGVSARKISLFSSVRARDRPEGVPCSCQANHFISRPQRKLLSSRAGSLSRPSGPFLPAALKTAPHL